MPAAWPSLRCGALRRHCDVHSDAYFCWSLQWELSGAAIAQAYPWNVSSPWNFSATSPTLPCPSTATSRSWATGRP